MRPLGTPSTSDVESTIAFGSTTSAATASASHRSNCSPGVGARSPSSEAARVVVQPHPREVVLRLGREVAHGPILPRPAAGRAVRRTPRHRAARHTRRDDGSGPPRPLRSLVCQDGRVGGDPTGSRRRRRRHLLGRSHRSGQHTGVRPARHDEREHAHVRLRARPRRRHRLRDRDRRAGQGRQRPALPRRRHRGPRRPGLLRQRLGPAGRQRVQPRPAAGRAVPDPGALRRRARRRPVGPRDARPRLGPRAAARHRRRRRRATTSPAPRSWRCRSSRSRARGIGQPMVPQREIDKADTVVERIHDPLARRARPPARPGRRRLLRLGRRARHERLDLHRPRHRLHRRRRRRRALRRGRRDVRPAARRRARPRAAA